MLTYEWFQGVWLNGLRCKEYCKTAWEMLQSCYSQAHREYHTWEHPVHCIDILNEVKGNALSYSEVAFAILCHDSVYNVGHNEHSDNVKHSAKMCDNILISGCAEQETRNHCLDNILATSHPETLLSGDPALTADIDMAVMGSPWNEYEIYMKSIESEYRFGCTLTETEWLLGRSAFLRRTLNKPIFHTSLFQKRYYEKAEQNIRREIECLVGRARLL